MDARSLKETQTFSLFSVDVFTNLKETQTFSLFSVDLFTLLVVKKWKILTQRFRIKQNNGYNH